MSIYIYKGNSKVSTNAIRNNKAVKAIYAKEQEQEAVCVWGVNLNIVPFTYTKSETSITITGLKGGVKMEHLRVPETIEELPVEGITYSAFEKITIFKSIKLPNTLTFIGAYAFYMCTGLTSLTIGNSATSIGDSAFRKCTSLTSATIGNGVTDIGKRAFYDCSSLTSIIIPNSVTSISEEAFVGCSKLQDIYITDIAAWCKISNLYYLTEFTSSNKNLYLNNELVTTLIIPNGVTEIASKAFQKCNKITSVIISDSVTSIGVATFRDCTGLTSVTIGNGVTNIDDLAFFGCIGLTNIVIPDNVINIYRSAFYDCTGLMSITIPNSVTSIGNYTFKNCTSLTNITFNGTKAQWNAITKGSDWNSNTGNYTIHCTDGDIPKQ